MNVEIGIGWNKTRMLLGCQGNVMRKEESVNNVSGWPSASDFSRLLPLAEISDRENLGSWNVILKRHFKDIRGQSSECFISRCSF